MVRAASVSPHPATAPRWLRTGEEAYQRMFETLGSARHSVRFEMYIFRADEIGNRFRAALEDAAARGARVHVLIDGFGSGGLPADYWQVLRQHGGEVRVFNPFTWSSFAFRNHRKLMVLDDAIAFVGGFNVGVEYNGDGVTQGWRDLGCEVTQPNTVQQLAASFDTMFRTYDLRHRLLQRMRHPLSHAFEVSHRSSVLLSGPRLAGNRFRRQLLHSLRRAKNVQIISGYFMPDFRLRRLLRQVVRRGGNVELMLAAKTDVPLAQIAARALYGSLLRGGIKIWEYQPQILHAKLAIVDQAVFVGSSNLDTRSFGINYELMVRLNGAHTLTEAKEIFATDRTHASEITWQAWHETQSWFTRFRGLCARVLLTKIDPWLARRQLRSLS